MTKNISIDFIPPITETAQAVLKKRYYVDGEKTWPELCARVARAIAGNEKKSDRDLWYEKYFSMLCTQKFLPNSPCLMNAGTSLGQLSACFVLPIEDSMEGIFETVKHAALVNKTGGGTGFSFSRLRAKDSDVLSTKGVASGPISFAKVFDSATDVIKQGGRRRGANMGVLRVDHPDIMEFIRAKEKDGELTNFNLSVAVTDEFMRAVEEEKDHFTLVDPKTGDPAGDINPVEVWNLIVEKAHLNGEPGILFIDAANRANPTPWLGDFEATNPCGEQWLLPYEACNLGSINLAHFVKDGNVDYEELGLVVEASTRFLDSVVDVSTFPIPEITEMTRATRKIGLGIMGLHDMLIQLGIPYDSEEGRTLSGHVMGFVNDKAYAYSVELAHEKGMYPAAGEGLRGDDESFIPRNAARTSIQPTGTCSMIADCSSGCEPYFSVVMYKHVMDGEKFVMVNKHFERIARQEGWYTDELMKKVADAGSVVGLDEVPEKWQRVFACAQDITVEGHIRMQAALQPHVNASISKTINMVSTATVGDVDRAYRLGWRLGCKGLTVYRDGSRAEQVLNAGKQEEEQAQVETVGPNKVELPDVLNAMRYRLKDEDGNKIYIIICFDGDKKPVEVFAKFPFDNRPDMATKSTMWVTTCRMVSAALRYGVPIADIISQLDKSSASMFDLPAQLAKLLKMFCTESGQDLVKAPCPDCGGELTFEEGCEKCYSCGFSKCA